MHPIPWSAASRREFLRGCGVLAAAAGAKSAFGAAGRSYTAAVIGHTGGGDYGHGYEKIFSGLDGVALTAVADPDETGRMAAAARCGAARTYADYRAMLAQEKPDLVSIAMRHPARHREPAVAAAEFARGILMEKPFAETPGDADAILAAAARRKVKIAVAHNRRYTPDFMRLKRLLDDGFLGRIREVRLHGKQDQRAGGEDLIVLGSHDFDMLRWFFGDPLWCTARVLQGGREIVPGDARLGLREPIRVAGDAIHAQFAFPGGIQASWSSVLTGDAWNTAPARKENWMFEILGSKRIAGYQAGIGFFYLDSPYLVQPAGGAAWQPLPAPDGYQPAPEETNMGLDLIRAVETDGRPRCSGEDGRWAVEMVCAVYRAHFAGARVTFPLKERGHPLPAPA